MALHGQTPDKIRAAVRELKSFHIGNVSGTTQLEGCGRLPQEHADALREADRCGKIQYILYSYSTPMAWLLDGEGWVKPQVKYSPTTSGHQSVFASAIAEMTFATV